MIQPEQFLTIAFIRYMEIIKVNELFSGRGEIRMKKLEIELYRYGNLVFGKILHQDESLRNMERIVEKNNFKIESSSGPALYGTKLFICGENKRFDNDIFYYHYCDKETATKICKTIKECVDWINKTEKNQPFVEKII